MSLVDVMTGYFEWHYGRGLRDLFVVWANITWFLTHLFSLPVLLRTLFAPWKRMHDAYHRSGVEDFFATLVVNSISRIFGAIVRLCIITIGLIMLVASAIMLILSYAFWLAAPILIPGLFLYGVVLLF